MLGTLCRVETHLDPCLDGHDHSDRTHPQLLNTPLVRNNAAKPRIFLGQFTVFEWLLSHFKAALTETVSAAHTRHLVIHEEVWHRPRRGRLRAALALEAIDFRFVRRYLELTTQLPLRLKQVDPLIR